MESKQNTTAFSAIPQDSPEETSSLPDLGPAVLKPPPNIPTNSSLDQTPVTNPQPSTLPNTSNPSSDLNKSDTVTNSPQIPIQNPWEPPSIKPQDFESFANINPLTQTPANDNLGSRSYVTADNSLGVSKRDFNDEVIQGSESPFHSIPIKKPLLLIILAALLIFGIGGFTLNEFLLNKISSLKLISDKAQFYLSLSVKKNPQAEKAKTLIKKFPGGDRLLREFDKYYTNYIGDPKDPLIDVTLYANTELLLSRISKAESKTDTSDRLLTIVDTKSNKEATEAITNFEDNKDYQTIKNTYKNRKIINIKEKSQSELSMKSQTKRPYIGESFDSPKPKSLFSTNIDNFLVASDKESDVQKAVDLSQTRKFFGFGKSDEPKSILDSSDHKALNPLFQKETFLKFFQRDPLVPVSSLFPVYWSINTYANPETEANTFMKVTKGIDVSIADDGTKINTYTLDLSGFEIKPDSFKVSDSLAAKLPKKFSGVAPTFYLETRNIKKQYQNQLKFAEFVKDETKNRQQKEQFEQYLKELDKLKNSYRQMYGLDYEKDLLSWLEKNTSFIFNTGSAKKSPELLIISQINDQNKVESSLKKLQIPNYAQEANDSTRKSDLSQISAALRLYYYDYGVYPTTLGELVSSDTSETIYIRNLPKDPTTGKDYNYEISDDRLNYTLSAQLEDGRTYSINSNNYYNGSYSGNKKETKLTPKPTSYKNTKIYSINIYNFENNKFYFYFAVAKDKAILSFSDSDKSLKEVLDFDGKETLSTNTAWKKQFSKVDQISYLVFSEPINIWGFIEYLQNVYPNYKEAASSYSGAEKSYWENIEKVVKGYLRTIPSIGTVGVKKGKVQIISSFFNIVELNEKDKKEAEDALQNLLNLENDIRSKTETIDYSILGINTQSLTSKVKKDWNNFYNKTVKQIIDPQNVLTN